jgi:hypothetical protein
VKAQLRADPAQGALGPGGASKGSGESNEINGLVNRLEKSGFIVLQGSSKLPLGVGAFPVEEQKAAARHFPSGRAVSKS